LRPDACAPSQTGLLLCGLVGLSLAGCGSSPHVKDVVGTYKLNRGEESDIIEVRNDSTYVHTLRPRGGEVATESGKWTLEEHGGEQRVIFTHFLMRAPKEGLAGTAQVRGIWPATIGRNIRGRIRLTVNDDFGWYYVREQLDESSFWKAGSAYEITLQRSRRPDPAAESTAAMQDVAVLFHLDTIAADSLYGRYDVIGGRITELLVRTDSDPGEVVGAVRGDSVELVFEPRVRGGSLRLRWVARGPTAAGVWEKMSHLHDSGQFRIIRR
jgi:hypothetical protein